MDPLADVDWVLWSGTVGLESPVLSRLPAAVAGGFNFLSVSPLDVQREAEQGRSAQELKRRAADSGLRLIMDPIMNWHPCDKPSKSRFTRFGVEEVLRMSEALEVVSMTAVAASSTTTPFEALPELFAGLCDQAATIGARVHLEFVPMTVVADLRAGWRIVEAADRPNGGLVFDTWHFFRGNPDFDLLETLPGERIFAVQINDAAAEVHGSMWEDTLNRRLPGDGCFELARVTRALARIGGLTLVGPEVFSPALQALPAVEAAQLAGQRVRDLLAGAAV